MTANPYPLLYLLTGVLLGIAATAATFVVRVLVKYPEAWRRT